ncbi:M15 family metallopeptidase [Brachybacterium sp. GCM10030267]|uniref:M15 family metallopeptidase n=1 Tax=Brachybacterium sp. GCM10030267 TaxID=3273381 RepID=UPI003613E0FE
MLLLSDPTLLDIPVTECGDDLVDIRTAPDLLLDRRKEDPEGAWATLRRGVLDRLVVAQRALPDGIRILVVEGHRPVTLQHRYFDERCQGLAGQHPHWSVQRVHVEASKHISPPAVAPHPCGAAVDLTLVQDGQELDLGCPVNATPEASDGACFTDSGNITAQARWWRDTLGTALTRAGMVNYPPEWWHWSFGDRYWAAVTGAESAIYSPRGSRGRTSALTSVDESAHRH